MVVVTNKPLEPEAKVKCKPEEPENVVRITENPLASKRYMKVEPPPIPIKDEEEAQRLLAKAWQSGNCREALQCIQYLTQAIDVLSLDKVIENYRQLEPYTHEDSLAPSAPPICDEDIEQLMPLENADHVLNDQLQQFINRCLDRFDANANTFLSYSNLVSTLSNAQMLSILTRDTFAVTNELLVYCACVRWAQSQKQYSNHVRLEVILKDLKYAPRYGLLTREQFSQTSIDGLTGFKKGGVLTSAEYKEFKKYITDKAKNKKVYDLKHKMSLRRRLGDHQQRVSVSSEKTRKEKCIMYTLICFTAVFD